MTLNPARAAVDIGIVVTDLDRMVAFHHYTVGLTYRRPRETGPVGTIHLLGCSDSPVKLLKPRRTCRTPHSSRFRAGPRRMPGPSGPGAAFV